MRSKCFNTLVLVLLIAALPLTIFLVKQQQDLRQRASTNPGLAVPQNLAIEQDDRNAILSWNDYPTKGNQRPQDVMGFVLYWGEYDLSSNSIKNPARKLTEDQIIQLQPLDEGKTYGAYIQSVDTMGNVSAASPIITFHSDPTRVNKLRSEMNGFFDDFNVGAGAFDELKWNNAYSKSAGTSQVSGQFINNQFHAHNQIFDSYADRGQNVSRPRAMFDFTSGVDRPNGDREYGTITFDMDGSVGRDRWYLDLFDIANGTLDVPSRASAADSPDEPPQSPYNSIRISAAGFGAGVFIVDEHGKLHNTIQTPNTTIPVCCDPRLTVIKNVRAHWVIKVSKQRIIVTINGQLASDVSGWIDGSGVQHTNGLELPYSKVYLNWVQFSYNTPKANMPSSLLHWDNFGFDAPVGTTQTIETHNYIDGTISTTSTGPCAPTSACAAAWNNTIGHDTIKIPDSVDGAIAQRLMFVNVPHEYAWTPTDYILFNGVKYSVPDAKDLPQNKPLDPATARLSDDITPENVMIPVTNAKTGDNEIEFHMAKGEMMNIHLELDFPKGSAPSYTQPVNIWHYSPAPPKTGAGISEIPNIGQIDGIIGKNFDGVPVGFDMCSFTCYGPYILQTNNDGNEPYTFKPKAPGEKIDSPKGNPNSPIPQSGTVELHYSSGGGVALAGLGAYPGHQSYQVFVDRQKIADVQTDATVPAPAISVTYQWDTTKFCNGAHQVFFVDFTPSGLPSQVGYFQLDNINPGFYFPITIYTNNPGNAPCTVQRVLARSSIYHDSKNYTWMPANFPGGTTTSTGDLAYDMLDRDLYSTVHYGDTSYTFTNLTNGTYNVILKFAEIQWPPINKGDRIFHVSINGQQVLNNFDILAQVPWRAALDKTFQTNTTNGTITVQFNSVKGDALIAGIAVQSTNDPITPLTFKPTQIGTPQPTEYMGHTMPTTNPQASPTIPPTTSFNADINRDGCVGIVDFNSWFAAQLGHPQANTFPDVNNDGSVDILDFNLWFIAMKNLSPDKLC